MSGQALWENLLPQQRGWARRRHLGSVMASLVPCSLDGLVQITPPSILLSQMVAKV